MPAWDFSTNGPPEEWEPPRQALWWLKKGDLRVGPEWERAHDLCQSGEGQRSHDLVHALAHWIEGDNSNADYWYRRAGTRPQGASIADEWSHLAATV